MITERAPERLAALRALADPVRLALVDELARESACACEPRERLDLSPRNLLVDRMLAVLREDVLPLTHEGVREGNKVFGAAVLHKASLELVIAGTNEEAQNPLLHGEALSELGIDASDHVPHMLDDEAARWADVVVATCDDACPVVPGKRYLSWPLPDPKHEPLERVREIRDEIERRVHELIDELDPKPHRRPR